MANRFLLQSGGGVITLQSGGGNLLLQSDGATVGLDGGEDAGWLDLPGVILGAVALAGVIASGAAQAQTRNHQDEVPYVTGNGIRYSQPYTQRAQVKPVFVSWAQGEELPQQAAPTAGLEESLFVPFSVKSEISLPALWPDETISRIQVEESQWDSPFTVPQIPVTPIWEHQDEFPQIPVTPALEESEFVGAPVVQPPVLDLWLAQDEIFTGTIDWSEWEASRFPPEPSLSLWNAQDEVGTPLPAFTPSEEDWAFSHLWKDDANGIIWATDEDIAPAFAVEEIEWGAEWLIPQPFLEVYQAQDDRPTPAATPQSGGGVVYDEISIFRWYQEDDLPIQATPLGVDEEPWKTPWVVLEPAKWLDSPDELIVPQPTPLAAEDDTWLAHSTLNRAASPEVIVWVTDDEYLPFPEENEQWPLTEQVFPGPRFTGVFSAQDEVLPSVRDEEPWIGPSYPAGPFTGTFSANDDIVPQPPTAISVEETYWIQPDPPRGVVTSWQFSIEVNEDFPELRPGPPLVVTPDVTGGWPMYYGRIRKPRIEQVTKTVTEIQEDIQQAKNRLEAKKELRRQEKRAKYVTEEIRQILDEQDRLKLSIEALRLQLKQAGMEEEEILLILALAG